MVKKGLLIGFCLFCVSFFMNAQEFKGGIVGGTSLSQVDGDYYGGYSKLGLELGGFVSRKVSPAMELQLDITYMQKGSRKAPEPDKGDYTDYKINLGYIQMPLVARWHYKSFSFEGGLGIGVLINSNEYKDGVSIKDVEGVTPFKTIEYCTVVGANYHFTSRLWLNARLLYSLNRVRKPFEGDVYNPRPHWLSRKPGQYNNNLVLSIYYAFD